MQTADANSNVERPRGPVFSYQPGSRPLEGYVIKRGLGQGGFGEVYFAVSDAGKEVALKVVRRNLDVELRGVTQCLNLKHPNLVGLYDVKIDADGNHWIVMEYVAGRRLVDVLADRPQGMPMDEALAWFRGIAAGTAYLHQSGIVHRDLKPANLFIENEVVKLGDYGLAKFISVSRRSGQTESVGTVHYMAPEIANGRYGKQIDIYALGVILYELTTGRVPFDGESVGEILMKHLTAAPDLSVVPQAVRPAVAAALAKDPELRPKTVDDLVAMVGGSLVGGVAPMVGGVAPMAGRSPPPPLPNSVRGPIPVAKPLHATTPHPGSAAAVAPSWYRPAFFGVTALAVLLTIFLFSEAHGFDLRLVTLIGGVWLAAFGGLTYLRNQAKAAPAKAAPAAGAPGERGSQSGQAAASQSPAWYGPAVFGVTAIGLMFVFALLRTMQMYDGNAQPPYSWGIIGVGVLWLAAMSGLNHFKNRYRPAGEMHSPERVHSGSYSQGASQGPRLWWFGIACFLVLLFFWMYARVSHDSMRSATPVPPEMAVVEEHSLSVPAERTESIPSSRAPTSSRMPTSSRAPPGADPLPASRAPSAQPMPAMPPIQSMPPTPQQAFSDGVTVMVPMGFLLVAALAGLGLWLFRTRLPFAGSASFGAASSGIGGDLAATMAPAVSRRAAAMEFAASIFVTLVATIVVGRVALLLRGGSASIEQVLWLVSTAALAASTMLAVERLCGGRPRDSWARRGPQAVAALPVGLVSWAIAQFLMIEFDHNTDLPQMVGTMQWPECFVGGQPRLLAHLAYFGLVFFAAAWWRQTDRRRPARMQISEIVLALLWAGVVNLFMPFPQPWGLLVVGTTATVLQFAAPWRDAGLEKAIAARLRGRP